MQSQGQADFPAGKFFSYFFSRVVLIISFSTENSSEKLPRILKRHKNRCTTVREYICWAWMQCKTAAKCDRIDDVLLQFFSVPTTETITSRKRPSGYSSCPALRLCDDCMKKWTSKTVYIEWKMSHIKQWKRSIFLIAERFQLYGPWFLITHIACHSSIDDENSMNFCCWYRQSHRSIVDQHRYVLDSKSGHILIMCYRYHLFLIILVNGAHVYVYMFTARIFKIQ